MRIESDIGPFGLVPLWVIEHCRDNAARYGVSGDRTTPATMVAVYAAIAAHADRQGQAHPSRTRLAKLVGVSVKSLDRAVFALEGSGAIQVTRRAAPDGGNESNDYRVSTSLPRTWGVASSTSPPSPVGDAQTGSATAKAVAAGEERDALSNHHEADAAHASAPARKPRARNELMDAMALGCGHQLDTVTRPMWSAIAAAIAQIKEVAPSVTPGEIREACERYVRLSWGPSSVTPAGVAKWWSKLRVDEPGPPSRADSIRSLLDDYKAPGS